MDGSRANCVYSLINGLCISTAIAIISLLRSTIVLVFREITGFWLASKLAECRFNWSGV